MSLVCPSCDQVPDAGATLGSACPACGATLVLAGLGSLEVVDLAEHTGAKAPPAKSAAERAADDAAFAPPLVEKPAKSRAEAGKVEMLMPDVVNLAPSDEKIELETGWRAEQAERFANKKPLSPLAQRVVAEDKRRRAAKTGSGVAVFLVLAVAAGGVYFYVRATKDEPAASTPAPTKHDSKRTAPIRPTEPTRDPKLPPRPRDQPAVDHSAPREIDSVQSKGVSIRIVGANGTPITIDGSPGGKTPASIKKTATTRPLTIGANGKTWKVIPDRDQTIDITQ